MPFAMIAFTLSRSTLSLNTGFVTVGNVGPVVTAGVGVAVATGVGVTVAAGVGVDVGLGVASGTVPPSLLPVAAVTET